MPEKSWENPNIGNRALDIKGVSCRAHHIGGSTWRFGVGPWAHDPMFGCATLTEGPDEHDPCRQDGLRTARWVVVALDKALAAGSPTPVEKGDGPYYFKINGDNTGWEVHADFGEVGGFVDSQRTKVAARVLTENLNAAYEAGRSANPPVTEGREDGLRLAAAALHKYVLVLEEELGYVSEDRPTELTNAMLAAALDDGRPQVDESTEQLTSEGVGKQAESYGGSDEPPSAPVAETDVDGSRGGDDDLEHYKSQLAAFVEFESTLVDRLIGARKAMIDSAFDRGSAVIDLRLFDALIDEVSGCVGTATRADHAEGHDHDAGRAAGEVNKPDNPTPEPPKDILENNVETEDVEIIVRPAPPTTESEQP